MNYYCMMLRLAVAGLVVAIVVGGGALVIARLTHLPMSYALLVMSGIVLYVIERGRRDFEREQRDGD